MAITYERRLSTRIQTSPNKYALNGRVNFTISIQSLSGGEVEGRRFSTGGYICLSLYFCVGSLYHLLDASGIFVPRMDNE
jgi:hypothetical protein